MYFLGKTKFPRGGGRKMDSTLGSLVFDVVKKLVTSATSSAIIGQVTDFFKRRRIELAVERAVLAVVEPLTAFLEAEKITPDQRQILVNAAERELQPFVLEPARLFSGSLNGDTIYRQLRNSCPLPQEIKEERLEAVYELLVPRMGTVLCSLLPVLDEWKIEAWSENFRRFDDIAEMLRNVLKNLDADVARAQHEADLLLSRVRRGAAQREAFRMDLTALRSDAVIGCRFDVLFIHPSLVEQKQRGENTRWVETESQALVTFLAPSARTVAIGLPGAGKSTWLRWLERIGNETGWSGIVVRAELRRMLREQELPSYISLLKSTAGSHLTDEVNAEAVARWRDSGRLAFLVDGFDEIPSDDRDRVYDWLVGLAACVGSCPVILTSRPLTTTHLSQLDKPWKTWFIDQFDERRIVTYIERWYEHAELPAGVDRQIDAHALAESWMADPTIEPLTGNPLLLATLLLVHVLDGRLPAGRAKLYQRYVDGMLGLWDDRQKRLAPKVALTPSSKRELLRELAFRMFLGEVEQVDDIQAAGIIEATLPRVGVAATGQDVLDILSERTGLLMGPGTYSFSHKTVAEFLVAEAIVDGSVRDESGERMDRMRLFGKRHDDRWTVVCFLWAGLAPTAEFERFVADLVDSDNSRETWALIFGLLEDQFERVSRDFWEMCINKFAMVRMPLPANHSYGATPIGEMVRAPSIVLRSLQRKLLDPLFRQAEQRGYFACLRQQDGRLGVNVNVNAALRWHVATHPFDAASWVNALQAPPDWPPKERSRWTMVAASWAFRRVMRFDAETRKACLSELGRIWAEGGYDLALSALWNLSRLSLEDFEIVNTMQFLAGVDPERISDERLICSKRECSRSEEYGLNISAAVSAIESAIAAGTVPNSPLGERALECARRLAERQKHLTFPPSPRAVADRQIHDLHLPDSNAGLHEDDALSED